MKFPACTQPQSLSKLLASKSRSFETCGFVLETAAEIVGQMKCLLSKFIDKYQHHVHVVQIFLTLGQFWFLIHMIKDLKDLTQTPGSKKNDSIF